MEYKRIWYNKIENTFILKMISSLKQTKEWRQSQKWYKGGRKNECEKYQIQQLKRVFDIDIKKTNARINVESKKIQILRCPFKHPNGYEYSENFDGILHQNQKKIYFNLKFVCGKGGAQTRTLKNVYMFIKHQYKILHISDVYFINILDGDESARVKDKFDYMSEKNNTYKYKCYIGDMYNLRIWYNKFSVLREINRLR